MIKKIWVIGFDDELPSMAFLSEEEATGAAELVEAAGGEKKVYCDDVPMWRRSQNQQPQGGYQPIETGEDATPPGDE